MQSRNFYISYFYSLYIILYTPFMTRAGDHLFLTATFPVEEATATFPAEEVAATIPAEVATAKFPVTLVDLILETWEVVVEDSVVVEVCPLHWTKFSHAMMLFCCDNFLETLLEAVEDLVVVATLVVVEECPLHWTKFSRATMLLCYD